MVSNSLAHKKIAVIHPQAHISWGAIKMMLHAANELHKHSQVVFCSFSSGPDCFPELQWTIKTKIFLGIWRYMRLSLYLRKMDVIFCGNSPTHLCAVLSRVLGGKATIFWWHHHIPHHSSQSDVIPPKWWVGECIFRAKGLVEKCFITPRIHHHIVTSRVVATVLRDYLHRESTVIYPVVEPVFLSPLNEDTNSHQKRPRRVITHGRLVPGKGVEDLIQVYLQVEKNTGRDLEFWIVGDGSLYDFLTQKYSNASVRFFGSKTSKEIVQLYSQSDVWIFASTIDAFGMSILESICMGKPTISLSTMAASEAIWDAKNGYLCSDLDAMGVKLFSLLWNDCPNDKKIISTSRGVQNQYLLSSLGPSLLNLINKYHR